MQNKRWTDEEVGLLMDNYRTKTISELSELLQKTEYSIRWKASQLKITTQKGNEYTKEEDSYILKNHKVLTFDEIAFYLGRSKASVSKRFHVIKPKKIKNYRKSWVQIEDDVPLDGSITESYRLAMAAMKVGQSFLFEKKHRQILVNLYPELFPKRFSIRKVSEEMNRIWRIA